MILKTQYKSLAAVALVAGMALMARGQAGGAAAAPAASAGRRSGVAVVNIVTLFDKLLEKAAADTDLANMKKKAGDELTAKQTELVDLQKKLETFNEGSAEFKQRQGELLEKSMAYEVASKVAEAQYTLETRLRTMDLYRKINDAVADYAKQNSLGLVLVADSADMDKLRNPDAFQAIVTTRKIIYFDSSYDITQALITRMNTDFSLRSNKK